MKMARGFPGIFKKQRSIGGKRVKWGMKKPVDGWIERGYRLKRGGGKFKVGKGKRGEI
jgi:hypothetical protein